MNNSKRLPSLPSLRRSATFVGKCDCGCGGNTQATFVPGHDAKQKGYVARVVGDLPKGIDPVITLAELGEWGGESVEVATAKAIDDKGKMKRWGLTDRVAAWRAALAEEEKVG